MCNDCDSAQSLLLPVMTLLWVSLGQDKEAQTRDMAHAEMIPTEPTHLSFWTKFLELQYKMFMAKGDVEMEHKYSSEPLQWPLLSKNVAYWMSPGSNVSVGCDLKVKGQESRTKTDITRCII